MSKRVNGKPSKRSRKVQKVEGNYWQHQIRHLGRKVFYVDTGAILECVNPEDKLFSEFFESVVGRLVTSSYVVAETVSRLVKAKPYKFVGPGGQHKVELAVYFLRGWLEEHDVSVLYIPEEVFGAARTEFEGKKDIVGCDLIDVISFLIVVGLEQSRIVSPDHHFRSLGLICLP